MNKTIIYYHPKTMPTCIDRGSFVRVQAMYQSFQDIGFTVILIAGTSKQRKDKIREVKKRILDGLEIEFVYVENTNAPILLAEGFHSPSNFLRDYCFFAWLKSRDIVVSVFYRDIYWRFDFYSQLLPWPLSFFVKPLCYLDWYVYDKFCDVMFLPSFLMNEYLPKPRGENKVFDLPPGFDEGFTKGNEAVKRKKEGLDLLYVGGVSPNVYDLSNMIKTVVGCEDVTLFICCRENEWCDVKSMYQSLFKENGAIQIVHYQGDDLAGLYARCDAFMMAVGYSEYREFAMPIKFFEAIGYGLPVISLNQRSVANLIEEYNIGWVLQEEDELGELLLRIQQKSELDEKTKNVIDIRSKFTWKSRARTAYRFLSNYRS